MNRKIEIGGKEIEFIASAATPILFKRTFGKDLTSEFSQYIKNYKDVKKLREDLTISDDDPDDVRDKKIEELTNNPIITQLSMMALDLFPKLAYIMYLEANVEQRELFRKLSEDDFIMWLMNYDSNDIQNHIPDFMGLWAENSRTSVKQKN